MNPEHPNQKTSAPLSDDPQRTKPREPVSIEPRRPKSSGTSKSDIDTDPVFPGKSPEKSASQPFTGDSPSPANSTEKSSVPRNPQPHPHAPHEKPPVRARITVFDTQTPGASASRRFRPPSLPSGIATVLWLLAGVVVIGLLFTVGNLAYDRGLADGVKVGSASKPSKPVPPGLATQLEEAIETLGAGNAPEALSRLQKLTKEEAANPIGSLKYLVARAALDAGDVESAKIGIGESIRRGERVSDSVALLAMLDLAPEGSQADLEIAKGKLREAIAIDAANPRPHIELARLSREQGNLDAARDHLRQAAALLDPIACHDVIEATETLLQLEPLADDALPETAPARTNVGRRVGNLYLTLRHGNLSAAKEQLDQLRHEHPPEILKEILTDRAFAPYSKSGPLLEFLDSLRQAP